MTDDFRPSARDQPETVDGEIVGDASAAAFGGGAGAAAAAEDRQGRAWDSRKSPVGGAERPAGVFGSFGMPPGGMSVGDALRMLTDSSPELRSMLAAPLRLLTVVVLIPSGIAAVFGLFIDGSAKFLAFAIAVCGGVAAAMLRASRRRLLATPAAAAPVTESASPSRPVRRRLKGTAGLIGAALLVMMLAIGFDLLAVLLLVFHVW